MRYNTKTRYSIAFFGSSILSSYWNGAATYYRGILKALHDLGHRVVFFEPDAYQRQENRDYDSLPYCDVVVYENNLEAVKKCLKQAETFDFVVKASGVGVFDGFLEEAVLGLRAPNRKVVFWDVDAPATLSSLTSEDNPFKALVPQYDLVLTYGGGEPVVMAYKALGAKKCVPVYNALDPETHHPGPSNEKFTCDLAFLGNRLPDREARVEEFFLRVAGRMEGQTFLLGGSGWQDKPMSANVRYVGHVSTDRHNSLNSSAKAVLNISRQSMADYGFSPATRVFEAAGAGACIITDYWEGIETFFEPGVEILVARNGREVENLLQGLTDEKASDIGRAAMMRVLKDHTYAQRATELQAVLKMALGQRPALNVVKNKKSVAVASQ